MSDKEKIRMLQEEVKTLHGTIVSVTGRPNWPLPPSMNPDYRSDWVDNE